MSIYDVVECPYCGHEHDMDTYEFDGVMNQTLSVSLAKMSLR